MPGKAEQIDDAMDSDRVASLLSGVVDHQLPPVLDELVTEYQSLPDARPEFVWQWVHKLAPQNTLPCVDAANRERVLTDKTLIVLFVTLLDDALEKRRDEATFQTMASIPFVRRDEERSLNGVHIEDGGVSPPDSVGGDLSGRVDSKYVEFAQRVWEVLITRLEQSQRYDRYEDLFRFDLTQAVNAIQYSDLVIRHPEFGTLEELKRYESHNMGMLAYADVDLMYSSDVPDSLALLRKGVEHGQQMARIGNWVSTWRRELVEGDYSSGVVVYAVEHNIVTVEELRACASATEAGVEASVTYDDLTKRIEEAGVRDTLLEQWNANHQSLQAVDAKLSSMDLTPFIEGTEEVFRYHLASTGLK